MTCPSTRDSRALRANLPLRTACLLLLITVMVAGCGKKGPPLAPFSRMPAQVANPAALRVGDDVYVSFTVPVANVDGQEPSDIKALEVYAVTSTSPPETEEQRKVATLIATLPVRPILPELPAAPDGTPLPPLPVIPGVDRGAVAVVKETLTPEARVPVELPVKKGALKVPVVVEETEPPPRPLVAPPPTELPRRHYFVTGISQRGRRAVPSNTVSLPLEPASSAPGVPEVTYTESEMTIAWPAPADARTSTFVVPPPLPPALPPTNASPAKASPAKASPANASPANASPANVSPGNVTPPAPPPLAPLTAKSLGFNSQATTYVVYETPVTPPSDDPFALALPVPLTPQPLAFATLSIKGVVFGTERCFFVRPVDTVFGVVVQGPASATTCVTPTDTFPPVAPKSLAAIASAGVITLIWEPNTEADLAGYLVLRGEAPGDKLQALTPAPITSTNYRDTAVKPGVRYVYAVVAVDKAEPSNVSPQSNRAEETARQ
jgi:hypothetical protein